MMKHVAQYEHIMASAKADIKSRKTNGPKVNDALSAQASNLEYFLFGFLNGMSFNESVACNSGLVNAILYGFECYQYKEVYLPWNTI
jgi:hypothetical protein